MKNKTTLDWNAIPEEYRYFAIDANGDGFVYKEEPYRINGMALWYSDVASAVQSLNAIEAIAAAHYIGEFDASDWENSLQQRPQ